MVWLSPRWRPLCYCTLMQFLSLPRISHTDKDFLITFYQECHDYLAWLRPSSAQLRFRWDSVWQRGSSLKLQRQILARPIRESGSVWWREIKCLLTVQSRWLPMGLVYQARKKTLVIENYEILNKRNELTKWTTTLVTQKVLKVLKVHIGKNRSFK